MKVSIYARSATGDRSQLDDQEARCREYAAGQGWTVTDIWAESGGGRAADRPGLRSLREVMATGQIDAVLATDAARFARDRDFLVRLMVEAEATGVALVLLDGGMDQLSRRLLTEGPAMTRLGATYSNTTRRTT
jgi:DNA invertase Pin-like site-specific DNA recombinase